MTEVTDLTTQRLKALTRELDELRRSTKKLNGEPEFRELADAEALPTKPLIQACLQTLPAMPTRPVFYAEAPLPPHNWHTPWFVTALLRQWGDPAWNRRISFYEKQCQLKGAMQATHDRGRYPSFEAA